MYFVIEITNRANMTCYVFDSQEKGLQFSKEMTDDVTRFETHSKAKTFWDEKNLDQFGTVMIRSSEYVEKKEREREEEAAKTDFFYLEAEGGEKLFQDPTTQEYFFQLGESGFCISKNREQLEKLIEFNNMEGKVMVKMLPKQNPNLKIVN